jgi:hypothetical protein
MILTAQQVQSFLAPRVAVTCDDEAYLLPSADYLNQDFFPWWRHHLTEAKLGYRKNIFDCDDFAREFARCLIVAANHLTTEAGICVAVLKARNITRSLGIAAGSHALNLVGVAQPDGHHWWVIEPQNSLHLCLSRYETADHLRAAF